MSLSSRTVTSRPAGPLYKLAKPRIALWDKYGGSMPSGHTRWLLEQFEFEFEVIGINAEDGTPTDSADGDGVVPYFALVPIGVTVDNIADTVIADGFRTVEEICVGDVAATDFCQEN